MKRSLLLLTTALILVGCDDNNTQTISWYDALKTWITGEVPDKYLLDDFSPETQALLESQYAARTATGSYLAGRFAQSNFDWDTASKYFSEVLMTSPKDLDLQRRAMVLSMGAGEYQNAFDYAHKVMLNPTNNDSSLPQLFLTLETFKEGNYAQVISDLQKIPDDGISEFVKPLFISWAQAGLKKTDIDGLNKNIVHFYHAILIADYRNDVPALKTLAMRDYTHMGLAARSLQQIASIFEKHGLSAQAQEILHTIPEGAADGEKAMPDIEDPVQGMSRALFDMASVLYQDYPDSAQLFAEMSLYLDPSQNDSRILMAHMAAQFKRYDEAISIFNEIDTSKDPALSIKLQRQIAELLVEAGKNDQAIDLLHKLVNKTKDIDAQIQIGDIYREEEDYGRALNEYNKAYDLLGGNVTVKYWNLLYARGISNERTKNWNAAEKDLKSALVLEPDHPYILNYLGYSWVDQGINLEEATRMIEKAVKLRPDDGYIVDSLGWAYYKQGKFSLASEALERAVELSANDATINDHLGDAYWQVGRKSEARFQWRRALSLSPDADLERQLEQKIQDGMTQNTPASSGASSDSQASGKLPIHD